MIKCCLWYSTRYVSFLLAPLLETEAITQLEFFFNILKEKNKDKRRPLADWMDGYGSKIQLRRRNFPFVQCEVSDLFSFFLKLR